jgi:hypothetical protein
MAPLNLSDQASVACDLAIEPTAMTIKQRQLWPSIAKLWSRL